MSLKHSIAANYVSQLYVTGLGILIMPSYILYMGAESYGLIGVFTMLQAWFTLLDMGLTPTISRETARYYGGRISSLEYRQLVRSLSIIFFSISLLGGGGLWCLSELIAEKWLSFQDLDKADVVISIQIMVVSVALRWLGGLYRGVITGAEHMVWLSGFNVIIATLRFVAVFMSMYIYGFTPTVFFFHQLAVALLESAILFWKSYQLLPHASALGGSIGWSFKPVKPTLGFALSIAFTSSIWVILTQTDKLILSGILSLTEYGHFTIAVLVASGILIVSAPVSSVIMPRMARLYAEGKETEMIKVYRNSTQLVSVIAGSAAIVIVFYSETLIYAWVGDLELATQISPVLRLYAIGNACLTIGAFPYYLQYARGNLRYHLIGNVMIAVLLIPSIIFAAKQFGGLGAGYVWLSINSLYLFTWAGYIHHKLVPGLHSTWLTKDFLFICFPAAIISSLFLLFPIENGNRWIAALQLLFIGLICLLSSFAVSEMARKKILIKFKGDKHEF